MIRQGVLVFLLYWSLLLLCCGLTIWFGGGDGRVAAGTVFVSSLANLVGWLVNPGIVYHWSFPALCDLLQLLCFLALMRRSNRWWPIWLTGFQIDAVLAHCSGALAPAHAAAIFRGLHTFWGAPILVFMVVGALLDHRAQLQSQDRQPR